MRIVDLGKAPGIGDLLGAGQWPSREWMEWWRHAKAVDGAKLAGGDAAELVFIVNVHQTGDPVWPQTALDYEVDGEPYTAISNFGFQICPPEPAACSQLRE